MLYHSIAIAVVVALGLPALAASDLPPQPKVPPAGMPAGYVMVSPCVPGMGEHWANPKDLHAPMYGTYDGKVVFSEIMVPKAQFDKGFNYEDLAALPGHTINHVDIEYEPHGHAGMPIPHYDIHAYYVSHQTHGAYCATGGSHA
ncbi:MAG TPA: hypothetical protein VIG51_04795 [Candidatus Baltobacteraceae bacterium]